MSHPIASPEVLAAGAADAARIGSSIRAANSPAAAQTTEVVAAAGDVVSAAASSLFDGRYCLGWCQRALRWFSLRRLWVTGRRSSGLAAPTSGGGA